MKRKEPSSRSSSGKSGRRSAKARKIISLEDIRYSSVEYELRDLALSHLRASRPVASESDLKTAAQLAQEVGLPSDALDRLYELFAGENKETREAFIKHANAVGLDAKLQEQFIQKEMVKMATQDVEGALTDVAFEYVDAWNAEKKQEMEKVDRKATAILSTPLAKDVLHKINSNAEHFWLLNTCKAGRESSREDMMVAAKEGDTAAWDVALQQYIHWREEQPEDPQEEYNHSAGSDAFNEAELASLYEAIKTPNNVAMLHHVLDSDDLAGMIAQDDLARDTYPYDDLLHYIVEHKDKTTFMKLHELHSEPDPRDWRDQVVGDLDKKYAGVQNDMVEWMHDVVEIDDVGVSDKDEEENEEDDADD